MKNKFLNISIGVTMMLLGAGFFVRSIKSAEAMPAPESFIDEGTSSIGKYMMQMYTNPGDPGRRYGIVWNTETGKSRGYYSQAGSWTSEKLFPENPLGE
jgi:hypothetical protein